MAAPRPSSYPRPRRPSKRPTSERLRMTTITVPATQTYHVNVRAAPQQIWDAITKPQFSPGYLFSLLTVVHDRLEDAPKTTGELLSGGTAARRRPRKTSRHDCHVVSTRTRAHRRGRRTANRRQGRRRIVAPLDTDLGRVCRGTMAEAGVVPMDRRSSDGPHQARARCCPGRCSRPARPTSSAPAPSFSGLHGGGSHRPVRTIP